MKRNNQHNFFFTAIIFFLVILGILTYWIFNTSARLETQENIRHKSFILADELKQSSDDLTRFCRTYVLTGDSIWENKYWEVLGIRNGIIARENGRKISLQDSMVKLGFIEAELNKLREAEKNSNDLVSTERVAFNAMKGIFADSAGEFTVKAAPDTSLAQRIMFDAKYHADKESIMNPIEEFFNLQESRTNSSVEKLKKTKNNILILIIITIFIIAGLSFYAIFILRKQIISQLARMELLNTDLDSKVKKRTVELENHIEELKVLNEELEYAKTQVEENELLLKKIAENYPNSYISIINEDLTIGFTSGQEFQHVHLNPQDFVGLTIDQIFEDKAPVVIENYEKTFKGEETKFELFLNNQHQLYKTVPLYNDDNSITKILSVVENITERKKTEKKLLEAKQKAEESDRLKSQFINNMSHEIRTPMNGILGFSNFIAESEINDEKRKQYIKIIQNCGVQLLRIIDDIMEISRLGSEKVKIIEEEICLNNFMLELFSIFDFKAKENKTPLYLKNGLPDAASFILTDKAKLNKIISNLIENALKYTNVGYIEFGYKLKNKELVIYVKDTGIGIHKDKQEIIFERFSQEEKELSKSLGGLGLGLSIAKENTELLGGKITLDSEKGKGAAFYVAIPYKPADTDVIKQLQNNAKRINLKKSVILVVEDEEINYLFLETLIANGFKSNYEILHAKNGKQALEICKKNSEIDCILMDLKMPIMNGFEATKLIKKIKPQIPIVAQTSYTSVEDREKALSVGCDEFISKPISEKVFHETLDKYLRKKMIAKTWNSKELRSNKK